MSRATTTGPVPGAADAPTAVDIIDELPRFTALRPQWNELLSESTANRPFLTWEWLYAWWTNLRGQSGLKLFIVHAGGQLLAIAPLRVVRRRLPWLSSLEFLGTGDAGSDYLDLIVRRGFEPEAIRALAPALEAQGIALRLSHLAPGSLASRLGRRLERSGWVRRDTVGGVCPLIRLTGQTWDSYLASRGPAHRANVRRRLRTAARAFDVRFIRADTESSRLEALAALARFHDGRWAGRRHSTAFGTPALQEFHRDATRRAHDSDWLRLYTLYLGDQLAGVMYAFTYARRFYFYQHGFDERYRPYSPGLLLMALTIRAALDEGALEFDLLYGVESYKWLWADETRTLGRLDLFPARLRGRMHQRTIDAEAALRALARRMWFKDGHAA